MKKCPNGHIYPDSLPQCPVCEKEAELQTILGDSSFTKHFASKPSMHHASTNKPVESDKKSNRESYSKADDDDRTIFLGHSLSSFSSKDVLGGWLIELNDNELPVKSFQLFLYRRHSIGRSKENHIVLLSKNKSVSRNHCCIEYKDPDFIIHDKGSANGTIVNNQSISTQILADNDIILLGDQKYWMKYL